MAIKKTPQGFALLIAVIFMSVVLALSLALSSLGYKQEMLASSAIESQYAFYAADAALECALYADQQQNAFSYAAHSPNNPPSAIVCDGISATQLPGSYSYTISSNGIIGRLYVSERLSFNSGSRCADVTIYKYSAPQPLGCTTNCITTYMFSQGYDVSCATVAGPGGARFVSRGISAGYK